jgi:hypothetical protein
LWCQRDQEIDALEALKATLTQSIDSTRALIQAALGVEGRSEIGT